MTSMANTEAQLETSLARIQEIEQALWSAVPTDTLLAQYQAAFREHEQRIAEQGDDQRHEFIIVIPVADRPQHLLSCLDSLLHLCETFGYGGYAENRYQKISVIIADDSKDSDNIAKNKAIARECNSRGLSTLYFGLDEQIDQMQALGEAARKSLSRVLGSINVDAFYHKGPSLMRNITYLELNKISSKNEKILFYFIDSDQEFQLKISTPEGDKNLYACNYFYYLDQIFSNTNASMLTGKVVGDPPVSPSVMAGNFLQDVVAFLQQIAKCDPSLPCQFHGTIQQDNSGASYHDMAALFGFRANKASQQYRCNIKGSHDNARCLQHFSSKLGSFFYGEHPTRKTYYEHEASLLSARPARTVYTGNYIFRPSALKHFIPFAALKLRMAGPVLGRLIKAELKDAFVSANLPMLHKRTVRETGQSEFRPGIAADIEHIDLSGEFERQFYGDVMLFSIEKLIAMGYPQQILMSELIAETVAKTHAEIFQQYIDNLLIINNKTDKLKSVFYDARHWWQETGIHAEAIHNITAFIANIEHNFSEKSAGNKLISSPANKEMRISGIVAGLTFLAEDKLAWENTLNQSRA